MKKHELFRARERIISLAKIHNTGSVDFLASSLDISNRTLKRMVKLIREEGIPIWFDRRKGTYRIDEEL